MAHQVPEWEDAPPISSKPSFSTKPSLFSSTATTKESQAPTVDQPPRLTFRQRFDNILPPHRKYLGLTRRLFLLLLLALLLVLLALILGLAIGLSRRNSSSAQDLPLPSTDKTYTGDLTYYGTGLGACGVTSQDTDLICAVSHLVFDAAQTGTNPNANPLCGKQIRVVHFDTRVNANRSIDVTVVDRCVGCQATDLDLSPTGFSMLADINLGRVVGEWAWL